MSVPDEAEQLITDAAVPAFLATSSDDRPHVAPAGYRYRDGVVEITTIGRKLENLRSNPRASLAIQGVESGLPDWTVILFGTATVVDDAEKTERAKRWIDRKYGREPGSWPENTLVRIVVGSTTYQA